MRCSFQPWKVHPFLEDQGRHTSLSPVNGKYRGGVDLLPPTVNRSLSVWLGREVRVHTSSRVVLWQSQAGRAECFGGNVQGPARMPSPIH